MIKPAAKGAESVTTNFPKKRKCLKLSLLPANDIVRRKLFHKEENVLESFAVRSWEIAPGETSTSKSAYFLPNQLERVTGWAFSFEHPRRAMEGGIKADHSPTLGFLLKNAWLIDGTLYNGDARSYLQHRTSRWPLQLHVKNEFDRGAIFCTARGNKWFGQWLMDDCPSYSLAKDEGIPVTTDLPIYTHTTAYENLFGMNPSRVHSAFFKEAVIFADVGQNRHKHTRFCAMKEKLYSQINVKSHPGVFILRGSTGEQRILKNEIELAEYLRDKRGFRILNPSNSDIQTILNVCAGAQTVVGVEGSGLIHGILALPPGGAILTLQPPNRFVSVYKHLTDRDDQYFGFVVGIPDGDGFRINPEEVERTLDLFPVKQYS